MIDSTHCHLIYTGQTVASKHRKHIRDHRRTKELKTYIKQKTRMSEAAFADVDWQSHERSVNTFKDSPHVFLIKFLHGWLPVGKCESVDTDPALLDLLLWGLNHWLQGTPIPAHIVPKRIAHLLHSLTTIGWDNFLLGWWSKHWTTLQLQYLQWNHIEVKIKNHGLSCSSNIICLMWDHCYKEWKTRNQGRYGKDADNKAQ
ncbi:hypothetical protein IV203_033038 [Nitzschia inconspicua]|uniref:Uncharacterized protein n=1 Tax=Nitzschia inconspicua TaxID=303405 RepID=A0A9K3PFC7_9STRA|nr:hypothetical protein IV203_033038 [Nitzschia inconspicua]